MPMRKLLLLFGLWAAWTWWRRRRWPRPLPFWALGAVSGLAAIVAMECGWIVTEEGRQLDPTQRAAMDRKFDELLKQAKENPDAPKPKNPFDYD